jgi:alanine racemase
MSNGKFYSTWVEINLAAIENNVKLIQDMTKVQVMAVVKANAYGHGVIPVAEAALRGGASCLGVARIEEAVELREGGLNCPILILGYTPSEKYLSAIDHGISITVWSSGQLKAISSNAQEVELRANVHLKVDTGMNRLGVHPQEVLDLAEQINLDPWLIFEGIFTHFARADELDLTSSKDQERVFKETLESLKKLGIKPAYVHAANSAATISQPGSYFSMVRPGIAIYGLHPSNLCQLPDRFQTALSWKTTLSQVKTLPPGRGVSYGHEYVTQREERIGTVPVGYADGFRRVSGSKVLIGGKYVPVVGRVCMDQILVQLDEIPTAKEGDEVVIIGAQKGKVITAEQVAELWGTINYEVVCGIGARVPRVYA